MPRTNPLLKITKALIARRAELRGQMQGEMDNLALNPTAGTGDLGDAAFGASGEEVAAQIAEIESRELALIEMALLRIRSGKYGVCNGCDGKIPVARLDALPYSVLCVTCQRESEKDAEWINDKMVADFNKLRDAGDGREVTLAEVEASLVR